MKQLSLLLSGLFIILAANAQTAVTTPVPDISKVVEIKDDNHDFGKIPYGKAVNYDVLIKNVSADSVKIETVKVGCGCTTPKYDAGKNYAPGEVFKVTLGFSGYAEGHFEKSVEIFFNNGLSKQVKFHGEGYKVPETSAPTNEVQKLKTGK